MDKIKLRRRKFWRNLTRLHKWAGVVIGIQILLWTASGFFMAFFDIDTVRGDHAAQRDPWLVSSQDIIVPPMPQDDLTGLRLRSVVGQTVWERERYGVTVYLDAKSGAEIPPLDAGKIRAASAQYYIGGGNIKSITRLESPPIEYRGSTPIWQVQYDDKHKTRLYIHPKNGDLKSIRTQLWRVYDFMWMLHIMDYTERKNFNSWWLKLVAGAAFLFAISGMSLVVHRIALRPKAKQSKAAPGKSNT